MFYDCRGDLDPQTVVSWKLYGRRRLCFKFLGSVEKTLGELFEGSSTSTDIQLSNGTSEIAVLKISGSNSAKTLMDELVPSTKKPSENYMFLDKSETLGTVFDAAKRMIDTLAGVHPAATVAWGFLSIGFKVLKNQRDMNQAVLNLYAEMISVYEEASKNDILQKRDGLHGTYSSLFKQTIECAMFIEGYAKKSGIENLSAMDTVSVQAEKFHQAFAGLKDQLTRGLARESVIVTLGVQDLVNVQIMRDRLRDLQPPEELGPKSRCTPGTRVETINTMVSWIAKHNSEMLWCKGLAGTGKSSLMETLHDLLTADIGGRSRLAAFVCYDRIEYSNANKLITNIAYALGTFDVRIGMTISKVVETSRSVMTMTDLSAQFRLLLRGPLERVPDLIDEGPLVVIIDRLDECDASSELLAVLAEGFAPKLPFMRLIVHLGRGCLKLCCPPYIITARDSKFICTRMSPRGHIGYPYMPFVDRCTQTILVKGRPLILDFPSTKDLSSQWPTITSQENGKEDKETTRRGPVRATEAVTPRLLYPSRS
ncbi:hypothetical protein ARMGADRAFT_1084414 [Armillaria gallica]|uniref:Nephrocystin 3-like N-terminal domain-containing protein n=1 Tax=Armillaria gallica TaxID=47427 RepID=A0A2H3D2Z2_ARMGA|nr:hypothetical protein ARMGADRAFT_1084414 [Armillaria gallica]